jgi:hypothetical protein
VEAARAEAAAEADEAMADLLVCLGQEEAKVGAGCCPVPPCPHSFHATSALLGYTKLRNVRELATDSLPAIQPQASSAASPAAALIFSRHVCFGSLPRNQPLGGAGVCLLAQVARLRERLEAFGVDCDALLADIVAAGEEGGGDDDDLT